MMQKMRVHVVARQVNGEGETILEQWAEGRMGSKDGTFYAFYEETGEGMEGVRTAVKWNATGVVLSRSGAVENRQEFRTGGICVSMYRTPYLEIPLKTCTKLVYITQEALRHCLKIDYSLWQGEEPSGDFQITMELEELKE